MATVRKRSMQKTWIWWSTLMVVMIGLGLLWRFSPLAHWLHVRALVPIMRRFALESSFAFPIFAIVIAVGNLAMVPINILLIAVALVFPGWKGFTCGMLGAILAAIMQFYLGRWLGATKAHEKFGDKFTEKFDIISLEIAGHGLSTVILLGLIPIGPNILTNLIAGICRIPLWKVIVGTFFGFLPGLIIMNLLSRQLRALIKHPSISGALLGCGLLALVILGMVIAKRYKARMEERYGESRRVEA